MTNKIEVRNACNPFPQPKVVDPKVREKTFAELLDECHYIMYENFTAAQALAKHITGSEELFLLDDEQWAIPASETLKDQIDALRHQGYNTKAVLNRVLHTLGIYLTQKTTATASTSAV